MRVIRSMLTTGAALTVALAAACTDATGPGGTELLQEQAMSLGELNQQMDGSAAARVEIALRENGPVARRVAIKTGDELGEPERLLGMVTGVAVDGDQGVLTMAYGVAVTFDVETAFAGPGDDDIGFEQFVGHLTEELALGREPRIKAGRRPADTPQDPDDPTFRAATIRITGDDVPAALALNVDRDNLRLLDNPPPDAILTVLGLAVEIRVSEGLTELILDRDDRREVAFEGKVQAVRDDGTLLLSHRDRSFVVRVVDRTRMGFNGREIGSLEPVARALAAGDVIFAVGEGIRADGTDAILAIAIRFKTVDGTRREVAFGGVVRELDAGAGLLVLVEGPTVRIGPDTRLKVNGAVVESLARVAEALAADRTVWAFGEGVIEGESDVVQAFFVRFEVDDGVERVEFAGRVGTVRPDAGTFTLVEGPTITVGDGTVFAEGSALRSLGGVAEALAAGLFVYVEGWGTVQTVEPRVIAANGLKFRVEG